MLLNSCFVSVPTFFKPQQLPRINLPSLNSCLLPCYATLTNASQRKLANYQPNSWNYDSLQLLSLKHEYADVQYVNRSMKLQEEVRRMINNENIEILELIKNVKRLGLGYHFEKEIREALDRFLFLEKYGDIVIGESLHDTALKFGLLREYGYDVSEDTFESFKDNFGNFKKCIVKDVKGMLSLYEISFLSYEGEQNLDEANSFTSFHLKRGLQDNKNKIFFEEINHSLELPLHRRFQRLETRWYIELYGKRKDANKVLLKAGTLDFNIVQSNLLHDLVEMSGWWKKMGLASKLKFSRDRLTECFFWAVGMAFENEFSDLSKSLTKVISLITTLDDLYDVYGTLDELELFTTAVESWDIKAVQVLPEYMKIVFLALYNTINELSYHVLKDHQLDAIPYFTKAWSDLLKSFLQEAKWCKEEELPKFDDYINNAWVSSSGVVLLVHTYFLLNHNITKQSLEALDNCHALLRSPSLIFRLCNDMVTYKAELQRGEKVNSIMCYMNENGVSEEVAYEYIQCLLNETWKKLNKDIFINSPFPKAFSKIVINLARTAHCVYQNGDGHGVPDATTNNRIRSLIIEPISLIENDPW